ncbi:hypothetical protein FB451DRAFT_1564413 [Mycena latifolia]|nr:hypothetical protein FB451DRAFT_1564413 [Mycena latifolia]
MVLFIAVAAFSLFTLAAASPYPSTDASLRFRTDTTDTDDPQFPNSPASCGECQENYDNIKLCMSVVPVMANSSTIIANPGSFINVISCACTDSFKAAFPQCVDCFQKTDQDALLNGISDTDAVFDGINKVCGLESAIFGVGSTSSITPVGGFTTTPTVTPTATPAATTTSGAVRNPALSGFLLGAVLLGNTFW